MTPAQIKTDLRRSGLPDEYIKRMGCKPATRDEIATASGMNPELLPEKGGYAIPYPGVKAHDGSPYRRFRMIEGTPKYLGPEGHDPEVYTPVDFERNLLNSDTLYISEGEKKAAALDALGFSALGIAGIHSWAAPGPRAVQKEAGLRLDRSTIPHPVICAAALKVRTVILIGDSDLEDNPTSAAGLEAFRQALQNYVDQECKNHIQDPNFNPIVDSRVILVKKVVLQSPFEKGKKKQNRRNPQDDPATETIVEPAADAATAAIEEDPKQQTIPKIGIDDWIQNAIEARSKINEDSGGKESTNEIRNRVASDLRSDLDAFALLNHRNTDELFARLLTNSAQANVAVRGGEFFFYQELTGSWVPDENSGRIRLPSSIACLFTDAAPRLEALKKYKMNALGDCNPEDVPTTVRAWCKHLDHVVEGLGRAEQYLCSVRGAENVLKMSRSMLHTSEERWDRHGYLFAAANRVFDLRTGESVAPDPSHLITLHSSVRHDPLAECQKWNEFLNQVQPDPAVRRYLQALAGYAAFASSDQQQMWMFKGGGANGKGTFLRVLLHLLGPYGVTAPRNLLVKAKNGSEPHPTNSKLLSGRRFVKISELAGQHHIDSEALKNLTGGDTIATRGMRENFSNVGPTWKIVCDTNDIPYISDVTFAMRRRLKLIDWPFTPAKVDRTLFEKIIAEASGILNWLLEGAQLYFAGALDEENIPAAIVKSTAEMFVDLDIVAEWMRTECQTGDGFETQSKALYQSYSRFLKDNGHYPHSSTIFGAKMRQKSISKRESNGKTLYRGIRLLTAAEHRDRSILDSTELPEPAEPPALEATPERKPAGSVSSNDERPKRRFVQ